MIRIPSKSALMCVLLIAGVAIAIAILVASMGDASADERLPQARATEGLAQGLVATFQDDVRTVSETVGLPELGLTAGESPHPAIKPAFTVSYDGFLEVPQDGQYRFETKGTLSIDGEIVTGERSLDTGRHALRLTYQRPPGELRFGLSWQSEHFVMEPVPPGVFSYATDSAVASEADGNNSSPPFRIREALAAMNCASCHDADFLGTMHHKFSPDFMVTMMRHANASKWYGAMSGPLIEENETLVRLAADLRKLPHGERIRGESSKDPNRAKHMVGIQNGFGCIACHEIKHHLAEGESKGTNLALITERVSYDWFVRWMENPGRLKPGVPMPAFFAGQEAAERQENIDALWDYLSQGQDMELPDELRADAGRLVLKPTSHPLYTRAFMRLPDGRELLRAICVGLPNGVSYSFDAETCQLAYVWTGGFLDMAPHWQNQSGHPTPAIGDAFHLAAIEEGLRIGDHEPSFRGYQLVGGIPRFEFAVGDATVHLLIDASTPDRVRQKFSISKRADPIVYVAPSDKSPVTMAASRGDWTENRLTITDVGDVEFTLTMERRKQP